MPAEKAVDSVAVKSVFSDSSQVSAGTTLRGTSGKELNLNGELLLDKTMWHFSVIPIDDAKSALIKHYQESLYATHFRGLRMFIETNAAIRLISQYFKS